MFINEGREIFVYSFQHQDVTYFLWSYNTITQAQIDKAIDDFREIINKHTAQCDAFFDELEAKGLSDTEKAKLANVWFKEHPYPLVIEHMMVKLNLHAFKIEQHVSFPYDIL